MHLQLNEPRDPSLLDRKALARVSGNFGTIRMYFCLSNRCSSSADSNMCSFLFHVASFSVSRDAIFLEKIMARRIEGRAIMNRVKYIT